MKDQYVILTGSKNNAGDFLIKYRAKELFSQLRPDRKIIDIDGWKPFTPEQLTTVNESRALILMGGPALQPFMYPDIYPMTPDLNEIKVPILSMAIGWKSRAGEWDNTHHYPMSEKSLELLDRINNSGYKSGVRDYHTLNVLLSHGFRNFCMTGCAALYSTSHLNQPFNFDRTINNVSFSLGVSFKESKSMDTSMKNTITKLRDNFRDTNFKVVFHHSIDKNKFLKAHSIGEEFVDKHLEFATWLETEKIKFVDISGSAENLINHYNDSDLHIGYRVHAHIYMMSISKPTILITEDGRGKALRDVTSGMIFDGYQINKRLPSEKLVKELGYKVLNRLYKEKEKYPASRNLAEDIINNFNYEAANGFQRTALTRASINCHFERMQIFLSQLP